MTIKERILDCLQIHPEGLDDDQLSEILGLSQRQTANSNCRQLALEGYIRRERVDGIIHNFWLGVPFQPNQNTNNQVGEMSVEEYHLQWYWEGNVQKTVVNYLLTANYSIIQNVNILNHERGIDVIAEKEGKEIWITVKGYPRPKLTTNPRLQAAHWFASAIYDIIKYREKDNSVRLVFALPDFDRYRNISKDISWFKKASGFTFYWILNSGEVEVD